MKNLTPLKCSIYVALALIFNIQTNTNQRSQMTETDLIHREKKTSVISIFVQLSSQVSNPKVFPTKYVVSINSSMMTSIEQRPPAKKDEPDFRKVSVL